MRSALPWHEKGPPPVPSGIPTEPMSDATEVAAHSLIAPLIRCVRNKRIILDSELASLYGVPTKRLNEQLRRNLQRFPEDFAFQLTAEEWIALRSQIATLKLGRGGHRKYTPYAFTEHGTLMAANILNSPRAIAMSVYVIRAFVSMREDEAANTAILKRLAEIDKTLLLHDGALRDIYQKLRPQIGFHVKEDTAPYRSARRSLKPKFANRKS
jgi:hypothetical protein